MKRIFILFLMILFNFTFSQDSIRLKIYRENVEKVNFLYADNDEFAPVSLEYSFTANNLSSSLADKSVIIIPAKTKKFPISELKAIDSKKGTNFKYNAYYVLGDVNVNFSETNFNYSLPFAKNKKYLIYQGYNGNFSHQHTYSLDFSLKTGEEVYAAREGKVVQVIANNDKNCAIKNCAKFNNKIVILHGDGTLAEYVHLKQNGSKVKVGENVTQNQLLGFSGNTGWSKGPHLHFSVFTPKIDGERNYIKTKFKVDGSKNAIYLEEKKSYSKSN